MFSIVAQLGLEDAQSLRHLLDQITTLKLTQAVAIITIAYVILRALAMFLNWLSERVVLQFRQQVKQSLPFWQLLILFVAIFILSDLFFDLSRTNLLALSGTIILGLGFAFREYISSMMAGIVVLFEAPYRIGDRIRIGEYYGEVKHFGLRSFDLQTLDDRRVTIPHNTVWEHPIINANYGHLETAAIADFYLCHDVDPEQVRNILLQAAYTSKYTQIQQPVSVFLKELPERTHFQIKAYPIDGRAEQAFKSDLTQRAKQAFAREKIKY
jgi:small-conductance mechanosensitive channel